VETKQRPDMDWVYIMLQWGHVFSDVETYKYPALEQSFKEASMGPRLFRRGNPSNLS